MYNWYDNLKDPTRFLIFFIPASTLITVVYLAPYPFNGIAVGLLLFAFITRVFYIIKNNRGGQ